ncbi:MAG: aminopeptidase P family protein [Lachnospiraceae bacterium]|nr:aminopeptidase P family protein [Lachnospiraceae bacterium]
MNMIRKRLETLRSDMKEAGIGICMIPASDCHDSEYVGDHFRSREYFSGFTGSAGTLVVTLKEAALFTDGRYFLQAGEELEGSGIGLMKIGEPGVPKLADYIIEKAEAPLTAGFDGRLAGAEWTLRLKKGLDRKGIGIDHGYDPAKRLWEGRPALTFGPVFSLPSEVSGEDTAKKLERIRRKMEEEECGIHILSTLDDIAWILNLRGCDIAYCPLFYAYMIITDREAFVYTDADLSRFFREDDPDFRPDLSGIGVLPYEDFWKDGLQRVNNCTGTGILSDKRRISYSVYMGIRDQERIRDRKAPSTFMKAVKNESELSALEDAHRKDGAAILRFSRWLSEKIRTEEDLSGLTEIALAKKLLSFRKEQEGFLEESFETISAFGDHGAIVHYSPDEKSDRPIGRGSFLLIDSGGHYLTGSTDVTRTWAIGDVSGKMKAHFTLVLRGMLRLLNLTFLKGARGSNLDLAARELFWEQGLDYKHGTGHGVGFLLSVHEGPQNIRWRIPEGGKPDAIFEEGMVTSDEPGLYLAGKYGIRIENEMACEKRYENEYGTFLGFRCLTYVPVDRNAIDLSLLDEREKKWLNDYHRLVYEKLSPLLSGEDLAYLKEVCEAV